MMFSIIVPVYNVGPYLRECLESVMAQSNANWEVVCVDDGSTDDSGVILDEYVSKDSRFVVIHQSNAGVSVARNKALERASGDWVFFLDADDALRSDALEVCEKTIKGNPSADAIQFGYLTSSSCRSVREMPKGECRECRHDVSACIDSFCLNLTFWQRCYRKEIVRVGFPDGFPIGEDRIFMVRSLELTSVIVEVAIPLYWYRERETSVMRSLLTGFKYEANLRYLTLMTSELMRTKKIVERSVWRSVGLQMTESMGWLLFSVPKESRMWSLRQWLEALRAVCVANEYSSWARFLIVANLAVRRMNFAFLTCYLPYWLKQHGIHR